MRKFWVNHLFLFFVLAFILSVNLLAQDRTWTTFDAPNGEWSILAPAALRPDEEAQKPHSKIGSYSYVDFNSFFVVIYRTYSKLDWFSQKDRFNKQRDLVLKASKGKLLREAEFTNGEVAGREVYVRMPDNRVMSRESNIKPKHRVQRFRMFFQGKRMYVILAVLPEEEINTPPIESFFKSFAFKKK
jgi:hypothetical protein